PEPVRWRRGAARPHRRPGGGPLPVGASAGRGRGGRVTVTRRHGVRLAGAPISWGVSEVPGWGVQLPPGRVLAEMAAAGLHASDLGPPGWLPAAPPQLREALRRAGLRLAGGFVAAPLHLS